MGKIILFFLFICNAGYSLVHPWVGITVGYLFNILGPQYIWWWNFQGLRPFYLIAWPTIAGFFLASLRGVINFEIIKNKQVLFAILYFLFVFLSYFWGPYVDVVNKWRFSDPYQVLIGMLKIFIFFFIGLCCISDENKVKIFTCVFLIAVIYLTYWANIQYLSGKFFLRLRGPADLSGSGLYSDENNFSMLFVVGIPFLFYLGWFFKQWYLRWCLWLAVPFAWHAVFLTASRGGLVGAAFVSVFMGFRCPKKVIGLMLISAFIFAYVWQGGALLKSRAKHIKNFEQESSSRTRLEAWDAGLHMMLAHPFTGVGVGSFGQAFPYFSDRHPRVAHNTFIQIAAESGVLACLFYVLFMCNCIWTLFKKRDKFTKGSLCYYLSDATLVALCGFLICALFLTLYGFEVQFYLAILANSLGYLATKNFLDEENR